jgi:hypothetical protein
MEFAGQVNAVATQVLNGEIDIERARVYTAAARTVAQAMSTEVTRARFIGANADLTLPQNVYDEEPDEPEAATEPERPADIQPTGGPPGVDAD